MKEKHDIRRYEDIIHLPHPDPATHPRMPIADRAAQFSPFAALTGYDAAIRETAQKAEQQAEHEIERDALMH